MDVLREGSADAARNSCHHMGGMYSTSPGRSVVRRHSAPNKFILETDRCLDWWNFLLVKNGVGSSLEASSGSKRNTSLTPSFCTKYCSVKRSVCNRPLLFCDPIQNTVAKRLPCGTIRGTGARLTNSVRRRSAPSES